MSKIVPLSEEFYDNLHYDGRIINKKIAERVKKLKKFIEENGVERDKKNCLTFKYMDPLHLYKEINKIFGEFKTLNKEYQDNNHSPQSKTKKLMSGTKNHSEGTLRGCGEWYLTKNEDGLNSPKKCGVHGLCPKCEGEK